MSKTHNPYLRLFTRDIEGSPKVNSLSMEASGLYFRLLNRLTEPPMPGSIALHDWDPHHNWQRSLTQQCLATPDKQDRLQYFAKLLTRYFQWRTSDILKALKELYFYGIIEIEGDRLIQPRMYRDNGYRLADDPIDEERLDRATGAYLGDDKDDQEVRTKSSKKSKKKNDDCSPARGHARHALSNESESNNNNDDIVEEREEKENKKKNEKRKNGNEKTEENNPIEAENENGGVEGDKNGEGDKLTAGAVKTSQKPRNEARGGKKPKNVADDPPTLEDVQAYFEERRQQGRPFIYITPEGFYDACCQSGWTLNNGKPIKDWQARCRTFENYRKEHDGTNNYRNETENRTQTYPGYGTAAGRPTAGSPSDTEVIGQSMRIIGRIRASREADTGDHQE